MIIDRPIDTPPKYAAAQPEITDKPNHPPPTHQPQRSRPVIEPVCANNLANLPIHCSVIEKRLKPIVRTPPRFSSCVLSEPEAQVVIDFDINRHGCPENVKIVRNTNTCFNETAKTTVQRWRYKTEGCTFKDRREVVIFKNP